MSRYLYFIHHSSYLFVEREFMLLFDYFGEPALQDILSEYPEKHLYILATHSHGDHYNKKVHTLFRNHPAGVNYIFHEEVRSAVPKKYQSEVTYLETGESITLDAFTIKAYGSTDIGGSFYIETDSFHLFHAGDLNNWHWNEEASPQYIQLYEQQWKEELSAIVNDNISLNLLMFPTDLRLGRDYLKGLRAFLENIPTKVLAPMHINGILSDTTELEVLCKKHNTALMLPVPMKRQTL